MDLCWNNLLIAFNWINCFNKILYENATSKSLTPSPTKKISVIEHVLPYKKGLIFDNSNYKLNIRTSMRSRNKVTEIERLDGIVNFGLLID